MCKSAAIASTIAAAAAAASADDSLNFCLAVIW
jgi:hypothetical protein